MSALEHPPAPTTQPIGDVNQRCAAELLCRCILDGRATDGALVEIRCLRGDDVEREWFADARDVVAYGLRLARHWNVYVGCLPRYQRSGGIEALRDGARMVWADCDTATAIRALYRFPVTPSFVIRSGGVNGGLANLHAWWLLRQRLTLDAVQAVNRALIVALGSCKTVHDPPRILRVPGTLHHKHGTTTPVECTHVGDDVDVHELVAALPALPAPVVPRPSTTAPLRIASELDTITPAEYVEHLTGRAMGNNRKVQCPLHAGGEERTPSLHCYPDADAGWYCYGCEQGGDVYTFAGLLWGLDTRTQFVELRMRLEDAFGINSLGAFA